MAKENYQVEPGAAKVSVVPLPVALYVSNGLIFELYDGGQPFRSFSIQWERDIPVRKEVPYESSSTGISDATPLKRGKEETQLSPVESVTTKSHVKGSLDFLGSKGDVNV